MTQYRKKTSAFSLVEISIAMFIFILLSQFCIIKYLDFIDGQNVKITKTKITDFFHKACILSLKNRYTYSVIIDYGKRELLLVKGENYSRNKIIERETLEKKLSFVSTEKNTENKSERRITLNGNTSKAFSLYIFDRRNRARHRIAFYTFSSSQFLLINNYKKIGNELVKKDKILDYHRLVIKNENISNRDWQKE